MEVLAQRFSSFGQDNSDLMNDFLEIDEAAQVLQQEDVEVLKKEQKSSRTMADNFKDFVSPYKEKKRDVKQAAAKAKAKGRAPAKAKGPAAARKELPKVLCDLQQSDYKLYMPPDSFLWKANGNNSWCGRLPPFPQVSRSWLKYGPERSLRLVVSDVWAQWCQLEGLELSGCPMEGLEFEL
mmetsp:Transcript_143783/g.460269  ORF Transcript_143783/g.460269 Transcript_143783/m.460269 type:complete len:181 (+) Transcript_143783:3843-4385(+)